MAAAHINYGLRPLEATEEMQSVYGHCLKLNIPLHVKICRPDEVSHGMSNLQAVCRQLRFQFFNALISEHSYDRICLGHTSDDDLEGLFLQLHRGRGINGIKGMLPLKGNVARPFIFQNKEDILDFLKIEKINWRIDSSNKKPTYRRNIIRLELIPKIENELPGFTKKSKDSLHQLKSLYAVYIKKYKDWKKKCIVHKSDDVLYLKKQPAREWSDLFIHQWLSRKGFSYADIESIINSNKSGCLFYSDLFSLVTSQKYFKLYERTRSTFTPLTVRLNDRRGSIKLQSGTLKYKKTTNRDLLNYKDPNFAYFDCLHFPKTIIIRNWHPGDRMKPLGMKGKRKSLKKIFVDHKIDRISKSWIPLITVGNKILWVPGLKRSIDYTLSPETESFYIFQYTEKN